jgi:hypothetical protein
MVDCLQLQRHRGEGWIYTRRKEFIIGQGPYFRRVSLVDPLEGWLKVGCLRFVEYGIISGRRLRAFVVGGRLGLSEFPVSSSGFDPVTVAVPIGTPLA